MSVINSVGYQVSIQQRAHPLKTEDSFHLHYMLSFIIPPPTPHPQSSPTAPKNYKERFSNFRPGNLCEHFYVCKRLKMHRYEKLDSYIVLSRSAFKKTNAKVQNYIFTLISTCFSDGQCVICGRFP